MSDTPEYMVLKVWKMWKMAWVGKLVTGKNKEDDQHTKACG